MRAGASRSTPYASVWIELCCCQQGDDNLIHLLLREGLTPYLPPPTSGPHCCSPHPPSPQGLSLREGFTLALG